MLLDQPINDSLGKIF